ncbi:MAG: CHAT domain-containing protein, partial [Candidatus Omnitrophica bacterium]|nr:CHAT domain-containing protein [Candidatus Omnitrophota bacterium]
WQASFLRVMTLTMMGKFQMAEEETKRSEEFEEILLKRNVASRSVRAEVRYWAGNLQGAKTDAEQVLKSIGDWRFPAFYPIPPSDQRKLADTTVAQVRSAIVLGLTYFSEGKYEEALPWLELADQTINNVVWVSNHHVYGFYFNIFQEIFHGRGMASMALGSVLLVRDPASQRAERVFKQGKEYFDAIGYTLGEILIHNFKTFALYETGRYRDAIDEATKGLKIAEEQELLDYIWRLETLRGQSFLRLEEWEEAERAMRHAQSVVDLMAGTMVSDEAKVQFGVGKETITNTLAEIDLKNNDLSLLFQDLERGRARAFISMLANKISIMNREESLVKEIRTLDEQILKIRQKKYAISSKQLNIHKNETALLEKRQSVLSVLRERDEALADTLSVSAASLDEVQNKLAENEAIFYTLPLEKSKNIQLLVIEKNNVRIKELKDNADQLHRYLKSFALDITRVDSEKHSDDTSLTRLKDLFAFLSEKEYASAYFVPSGDLFFIPWGALDVDYPISVIPTGSWIIRSHSPIASMGGLEAAVVGDPNFGGLFPQLPGAKEEAIIVGKYYNSSPLIGPDATEEALRGKIKNGIEIVHLATHALFDPVFPLQSALILTDGQQAKALTAQKLYEEPLKANIVILSACETGLGQVISGDDLLGLNRSFYLGGTMTIVSSLWPVDDEPTKMFMEHFHQNIKDGNYGRAWIKARDALMQKGFPASVYGSFNMNGLLLRN